MGGWYIYRIVKDLLSSGYDDGISIEPRLTVVYHNQSVVSTEEKRFNNYVEYGRRMKRMISDIRREPAQG